MPRHQGTAPRAQPQPDPQYDATVIYATTKYAMEQFATKMIPMTSPFSDPLPDRGPAAEKAILDPLIEDVEKEFSTMVIMARQAIRKRAAAVHPELQPLGYKVLSLLVREHARQQIILAEELQVDKATMSRMIKWLEAKGLVTRQPDPADGRAMLVSITDAARAGVVESSAASRQLLRNRLNSWEPEEIKRFADLLSKLNANDASRRQG
ncbi:MarR family winged helix-turn-helix transcriptional regulator [Paeniglutamicibacter gangotriensis]|uniref:MarR family transcriptional regulator n=1 Tax=Paeniglutamicibacter gangotriensis Lz1y TaxID=1276920 RepID=M7NAB3_9MICC|nr:MarR family transcriptional regulator [Paeniglutamicibacter gangotriensis]EMQ98719.1 MarR family transcriptional regulator [Paeniglutamicibacter gangotriensis Lz1y]